MGKKKNRIKKENLTSMNFEELKEYLNKCKIKFFEMEDEDADAEKEIVYIYWCEIGDNFYDYGEKRPKHTHFYKKFEFLRDDPRVVLLDCADCCGCASW